MANAKKTHKVEFVSYSGRYPTLCMGELVVRIDGAECRFCGTATLDEDGNTRSRNFPLFWHTGGSCCFTGDWEQHVECGEWELFARPEDYPEMIRECLEELLEVFNDNVQYGCCGGCL